MFLLYAKIASRNRLLLSYNFYDDNVIKVFQKVSKNFLERGAINI